MTNTSLEDLKATLRETIEHKRRLVADLEVETSQLAQMEAAYAALEQAKVPLPTKPRRTRADKGKRRKAAKVEGALGGETNYEGPDGKPVAGAPDFGDKPADWCPAQGSQVSASGCKSRQDINPAGCPTDCQRRKKA